MKKILFPVLAIGWIVPLQAEPLSRPVLERYEQMLLGAPEAGTPFDKVYQHYLETEGLEALAARWREAAGRDESSRAGYLLLLGLLDERRGNTDGALKELREAANAGAGWRGWLALADAESRAGQLKEAVASYKKALELDPPHDVLPRLYRGLALSQQRQMDFAGAVETWEAYAKASPDDPFVLEEAGDALLEAGRYGEADRMFARLRAMKDLDPARALSAVLRQAEVRRLQGNTKEALELYETALAESGEASWLQREIRSRIERLFLADDDLPGLAAYYRKQLESHPADVETALRLSDVYLELNRNDDALKALEEAAGRAPGRKDVQQRLAAALVRAERPGDAVTILEALTKKYPEDPEILAQLGEAQWQEFKLGRGESSRAVATWRKLAPEGADANAVQRLAEIFRAHQLTEEAVTEYRRALTLDPASPDRRERLAVYLAELGRKPEALTVLSGMVEDGRASGETYLRLARIQRRLGEPGAARQTLQAAKDDPDRAFDRLYLLWQLASEDRAWEEAEKLAVTLRTMAQTDPERERADDCLLQALRERNRLGGEIQRLLQRQKTSPDSLNEGDWRLLYLLADASGDLGTAEFALQEGLRQFPQSAALTQIEQAFARRTNNMNRRLAALERLEKIEPQRAGDWMAERVRALREANRMEEATALARRVVAHSPARADGYVLLAETLQAAQKRDEAVQVLQEAVRLSENPNQVRFRLVDLYLAEGNPAAARSVMDEAFEAEESPAAKLQIMSRLADVYLQAGRLDELIAKLRNRQKAEQGWRYAMYLAEVYLVMQDSLRAMEELDKALAGKPDDPLLLRRLLMLARETGDTQAVLRYARKLAEVEPSAPNRAQLGEALANDGKIDEALNLIRENSAEFLAEPSAWEGTLRVLQAEDKAAELAAMLENRLRADPRDWRSLMALGEILMGTGQTDKAAECFWKVMALHEDSGTAPPAPTPSPAGGGTAARLPMGVTVLPSGGSSTAFRPGRFTAAYQRARQLLAENSAGPGFPLPRQIRRFGGLTFGASPTAPQSGPAGLSASQEDALVYLACIAAFDGREKEFLERLAEVLRDRPAEDRIEIYSLLQAPEAVLTEIENELARGTPDPKVINTAYNTVQMILGNRRNNPNFQKANFPEERLKALSEKLSRQMGDSTQPQNVIQKYQWLISTGKQDEAEKLVDKVLAETDESDVNQLNIARYFAMNRRDYDRVLEFHGKIQRAREKQGLPRVPAQDFGIYLSLLDSEKHQKKAVDLLADEFLYSGKIAGSLGSWGGRPGRQGLLWAHLRQGNLSPFIPLPTPEIDVARINILRSIGQNPKVRPFLPEMARRFAALGREKNSAALRQAAVWLRWFGGDRTGAEKELRALRADQSSDELALNHALLLLALKKPEDARQVLDAIQARSGSTFEAAIRLRLSLALEARDLEAARELLTQLQGVRLEAYEVGELAQNLQSLGLTEEAAKIRKRNIVSRQPGQRIRQTVDIMRQHMEKGDRGEATAMAHALLSRDPFSRSARNERHVQYEALQVLKKFGELDAHIDRLRQQLEAAPDSARLNAQLAVALQARDPKEAEPYFRKLAALRPKDPEWLQQYGLILLQAEKYEEAMEMYDRILRQDPALLFAQGTNFLEPYRRTKSWQRLVEAIKDCPDPKIDPFNPYRQNYSHIFSHIGTELQRARPPVDPTDVWLKGLAWSEGDNSQLRPRLVQALVRSGRTDEARRVIEEAFFPRGRDDSSARLFVYYRNVNPNTLWSQWSTKPNGELESPAMRLLHLAANLGILKELLPRIDQIPVRENDVNPKIMARLVLRDPAVLPEIRKLVDRSKDTSVNPFMLRAYAAELANWPEGRDLAYRCLEAAIRMAETNSDFHSILLMQFQVSGLAIEDGKTETARNALKNWGEIQTNRLGMVPMNFATAEQVIRRMISVGLIEQARSLLAVLKSDRNYGHLQYKRALDQLENELALLSGRQVPLVPAIAWVPSAGTDRLVWDLRPAGGSGEGERTIWMNSTPLRKVPGKYTLEVYFGPSENEMKRLFSKTSVPARGEWKGQLPASRGFLKAVLRNGDEMSMGPIVPVAKGTVLLAPENLEQLPHAKNGVAKGWSNVPPVRITLEKGGPVPGGTYARLEGDRQNEMELSAERVRVDPAKNYLLGVWIRYPEGDYTRVGWRFYDANGTEIGHGSAGGIFAAQRWNYVRQRFGRGSGAYSLTSNVAWIEPFIEFGGQADLLGLFVLEEDSPTDN